MRVSANAYFILQYSEKKCLGAFALKTCARLKQREETKEEKEKQRKEHTLFSSSFSGEREGEGGVRELLCFEDEEAAASSLQQPSTRKTRKGRRKYRGVRSSLTHVIG